MREMGIIIKMRILFCAVFVLVFSSRTMPQSSESSQKTTSELIRKSQEQKEESTESMREGLVLHFPKECSYGRIMIRDSNVVRDIETFYYWIDGIEWESFGEAQGDVKIPLDKKVRLILNSWTWQNPQTLSALKQLNPDDIYSLTLSPIWSEGGRSPNDKCMPYISHLSGLRILDLTDANITSRGLKYLTTLKSLERLYTPRGLTNDSLSEIVRLPALKALYIRNYNLTDTGLAHLAKLPLLEEFVLRGEGHVYDAGLAHLVKVPRLRYLLLDGETFTDAGIAHLKNSPSLRILHFGLLKRLTDSALIHLSEIPQLERINFHWNENITDVGIVHLTKLKSLTMLDIKNSKVTDEGLAHLAKIKTLENLTLPDKSVTDASIEHIVQLQNLRYLWANSRSDSPLTDESLRYVSELRNLEALNIGGAGFSDEGMKYIAKLTKLKRLWLFKADLLTNKGLEELANLESLTNLSIGRNTKVSISGLKSLNRLKNLKDLDLDDIHQDNSSFMDLSGLTELERLEIRLHHVYKKDGPAIYDSFRDQDWASLAKLTKLTYIQMAGSGITDNTMKHLSGLENLWGITISTAGKIRLTDETIKSLTGMKKLNLLTIGDGHFTDKALEYLDDLPSLTLLELTSDYAFSNKAIRDFQRKNPHVTRLKLMP